MGFFDPEVNFIDLAFSIMVNSFDPEVDYSDMEIEYQYRLENPKLMYLRMWYSLMENVHCY